VRAGIAPRTQRAQPAMVKVGMICDRFAIDLCNDERTRDLECIATMQAVPTQAANGPPAWARARG